MRRIAQIHDAGAHVLQGIRYGQQERKSSPSPQNSTQQDHVGAQVDHFGPVCHVLLNLEVDGWGILEHAHDQLAEGA